MRPAAATSGATRWLALYVVLMPFMSALAPSAWLPLPLIVLLISLPWLLSRRDGPTLVAAVRMDAGFLLALWLGIFAVLWGPLPLGPKHYNYIAAVAVSYGLFLVAVRSWLCHPGVTLPWIGSCAHLGLTILAVAVIVEFVLASFFGYYFADFIPFAHADLNIADLVTDPFKRPRAFAHEPGFTALAFECLWPLTLLAPKRRGRHVLYAVAFALLASAAAMVAFSAALGLLWLVRSRSLKGLLIALAVAVVIGASIWLSETAAEIAWSVVGRKFDIDTALTVDIAEGGEAVTVFERASTYLLGLQLLTSFPLGIGWGSLGEAFATDASLPEVGSLRGSGMLSLYLDVAVASGWLGLLGLAWFVVRRVVALLRSTHVAAMPVTCALLTVTFHHMLITEFQFPFLWFAIAVADRLLLDARLPHGIITYRPTASSHARTPPP
jgi:hypothetical protein